MLCAHLHEQDVHVCVVRNDNKHIFFLPIITDQLQLCETRLKIEKGGSDVKVLTANKKSMKEEACFVEI